MPLAMVSMKNSYVAEIWHFWSAMQRIRGQFISANVNLKKITFLLHEYKTDGNSDQECMYSIHLFILKDIYLLFFPAEFQIFSSPCICKIEEGTTCQSDISGDEQSQKCLAVWILSFLVSCVASSSFSLQNYVVEIFNGFMGRK